MTHSHAEIRALLQLHGLQPSRALGQNFVGDANTVRRIARLAEVGPGDRVVEVGPGLGSLTLALLETGASVTAVEMDRFLIPVLRHVVEPQGATVVHADALEVDWHALLGDDPWMLVANLPYNVATPLVLQVLEQAPMVTRMLVMVQREVGERFAARPGSKAYGAVTVKTAWSASASLVGKVPPTVFVPQPKVDSALVRLDRHGEVGDREERQRVFGLVEAGFATRRKMLRNTLSGRVDEACFEAAGVAPTARAEELVLEDWRRLAACSPLPPS
ncbi:MAG TPA: 16S rRNA (adenine(1518)-N(6)/adenine(1519)-N(6))-dimethyltransferase RsmA [Acidimicrobiales bacterium]|nr:16S rRNA (adenine(1518)-N(6)/adenine(1519)-N(6))-dimethyltransferase RsmA [Acidimicrobiales bacterium]